MTHVFVDYDGTITDRDTFDALVNHFAGASVWQRLSQTLRSRQQTLREALAAQAGTLRCTLAEADDYVRATTRIDPAFRPFVERCRRGGYAVTIVSAGLGPLIELALARNGLSDVPLLSNGALADANGWRMRFRDASEYGHDKSIAVRGARERGEYAVYVGDGISDVSGALAADRIFAKRGRSLERILRERGVEFTPFDTFADVEAAMFSTSAR